MKYIFVIAVFEIVLRVCEGMPWQEAILKVLPLRKGAHLCKSLSNSSSSEDILNHDIYGT